MSYTPILPFSGYAGWSLLNRTMERQMAAFTASQDIQRTETYFREKIGSIKTAEDLVADRRLLTVALGAFGLDADINNKYFIRKVLNEGTLDSKSLANSLSDKSYFKLSEAFGFGDFSVPRTQLSEFADEILAKYENRQFEAAVGEADDSLRLALSAQRELPEIAATQSTQRAGWFSVIGSRPMSSYMQTVLGLPAEVAALDVDQQVEIYQKKAFEVLGSSDLSVITTGDSLERLNRIYFARAQIAEVSLKSHGAVALDLLRA